MEHHEYVDETKLRLHTVYEQACQNLQSQQKRHQTFLKAEVHGSRYTECRLVFLQNPSNPQGLVSKVRFMTWSTHNQKGHQQNDSQTL